MFLDPIATTKTISDNYISYLSTIFRLRDEQLREQFEEALRAQDKFIKGPILEATPPFETGSTIEQMVQEGVLSRRFRALNTSKLPPDRPLYVHQETAVRRVVTDNRNIIVASGTGSGKTEAFLISILDRLFREFETGVLTPGVRALLLYPMNALANDQMARMRDLLQNCPSVTFGRYTGETPDKHKDAVDQYVKMYGREPLSNELVSRQQMRSGPPHVLLTNYAMLEYLLLRPEDNVFFDGECAGNWRFIVVDEAHTYAGAQGIEMAMLLRRLKDRVVSGEHGRLTCIATSATLGGGEKDYPEIVRFATQLFGETFEWVNDVLSRQDVVRAIRKPMADLAKAQWTPDPSLYTRWQEIVRNVGDEPRIPALIQAAAQAGVPADVLKDIENSVDSDYLRLIFKVLAADTRVAALRQSLEAKPLYLGDAAEGLFGDHPLANLQVVALVDLAASARPSPDDQSLIPARYHLFVRAVEGAYLALRPKPQVFLERHEYLQENGETRIVFEMAACRQCGAAYVVGEEDHIDGRTRLVQPGKRYFEDSANLKFNLILDLGQDRVPDDEDEVVGTGDDISETDGEPYQLCTKCGAIDKESLVSRLCDCDPLEHARVIRVPASREGAVRYCPACGSRSPTGLVWRFLTGKDATSSVLATALYQHVPPRAAHEFEHDNGLDAVDEWSSTLKRSTTGRALSILRGDGRQLLVFSDSRQDAAFFAPYLSRTYSQILRRRLILQTLDEHCEAVLENRWRVQDLINPLRRTVDQLSIFPGLSAQEQEGEAWKWVLHELVAMDRRNSLEGLGCLGFTLVRPQLWRAPVPLLKWGLDEDEVWTLFQILLDTVRVKGAIVFPDSVSPEDEFFKPRNREYYFRGKKAQGDSGKAKASLFSWSPVKSGGTNARLDFLTRFARETLYRTQSGEELQIVLSQLWTNALALHDPSSCWHEYFSSSTLRDGDVVYRMKPNYWELQPAFPKARVQWYMCDTCNSLTLLNLHGICPTYKCAGRLRPCDPGTAFAENHYRRLYLGIEPVAMVAEEHTAQLTSTAAAELQAKFVQGEVNILSCSTTFELGVDVGQLESVFMRNVPPSAANYIQRAGRAGRRTNSTAFALTFAQRRSHDLTHFNEPLRMVSGKIRAPSFEIENEKIVRRHIHAIALATFWKKHPETFGTVEDFFFRDGPSGSTLLAGYLGSRPEEVRISLARVVPETLYRELDLDKWEWVDWLFDSERGSLFRAEAKVTSDVLLLEEARQGLVSRNRPSDHILRTINTMKKTYLISFLASQNVIPKYGFPVDVVSLQLLHHGEEARRLELDRDLRIALSEYAPGGQVVAGGKLWTSRYLKRLPDRGWRTYRYGVCDSCQHYQRVPADSEEELTHCQACGQPFTRNKGTFLIPEFGFIASNDPPAKPGESRPERTYATRTYFSGSSQERERIHLPLMHGELVVIPATDGELAVINHAGYMGFKVCDRCGYTLLQHEKPPRPHPTPWRTDCNGMLRRFFLGYEFKTDVLQLRFSGYSNASRGFWLSLLYAVLEGTSEALDIDRQDIDGSLFAHSGDPTMPALVLFDDVPGGAGHVRRIARDEMTVREVLATALRKLERCECGGLLQDTSCYGCLRNYGNQFCHDELSRGPVIKFLSDLGF